MTLVVGTYDPAPAGQWHAGGAGDDRWVGRAPALVGVSEGTPFAGGGIKAQSEWGRQGHRGQDFGRRLIQLPEAAGAPRPAGSDTSIRCDRLVRKSDILEWWAGIDRR